MAGCVFLVCHDSNVPLSLRRVMEFTKVNKKETGRTWKLLDKFLINQDEEVAQP